MGGVKIQMRDGTELVFKHEGRAGGSYSLTVRYEPGFVVVTDEYYREKAIPTDLVASVVVEPSRY